MARHPTLSEGIALTHFIVTADVDRAGRFYNDVLGGEIVLAGEPTIVALANSWIIINLGGGPRTTSRTSFSNRHRIPIA
jgi:hypothetical protein